MATYPNINSASDVWSLRDVYKAEAGDEWPALSTPGSYQFSNSSSSVLEFEDDSLILGSYSSFTIESWFYSTNSNQPSASAIFCNSLGGSYHPVSLGFDSAGNLIFNHSASGSWDILFAVVVTQSNLIQNQWVHTALVWDGSQVRIYYNGFFRYSASISTMLNVNDFRIGRYNSSVDGYISNLRVVTNSVLYTGTGAITVPTEPLTAITGTKLLTCNTDPVADVGPNTLTPTDTTGVVISNLSPFS